METRPYSWVAHDTTSCHPTEKCGGTKSPSKDHYDSSFFDGVDQEADQVSTTKQVSSETIIIRDSCNVDVETTETQVAASLQAAIQVGIALVVNLSIADSSRAERVTQELLQKSTIKQVNHQKLVIENSRDVSVITTDTDVAVSLQLLIQLLLALVISIDIL
ncbi:spore coat protein [Bacillus lacus]|uniref:Spore coat protein n=1 Tax=Metabacillus lacus TaxID=1983721 RepID=A0A7X2IYP4_9BACI|nr:spore coat protein [Metabacillus lacus]MRX71922.1 spore coat protein [Metabacillus lacus]